MTFRALHDRILVRRRPFRPEVTRAGIRIPDEAVRHPYEGVVAAVGLGKWTSDGERATPELKIGDNVLFAKYAEQSVKAMGLDDGEYVMMRESDVLGVLS